MNNNTWVDLISSEKNVFRTASLENCPLRYFHEVIFAKWILFSSIKIFVILVRLNIPDQPT